jgi:hypothetical protein
MKKAIHGSNGFLSINVRQQYMLDDLFTIGTFRAVGRVIAIRAYNLGIPLKNRQVCEILAAFRKRTREMSNMIKPSVVVNVCFLMIYLFVTSETSSIFGRIL